MKTLSAGILLAIALSLAAPMASARPPGPPPNGGHGQERSERGGMSLDQAVERVRRDTGGRVLSAETVSDNGRRSYRIKVLTPDRRVRVINVGAGGR